MFLEVINKQDLSQSLVSVGITTYNRPNTLLLALRSVINQSYKNLEIIVSNDCSTDLQTENIARNYMKKDSRIKYFCHKEHKGVTLNFNFTVSKASGEYFMWLCDDDWIDSNYIAQCLQELKKNSNFVLVSGRTKFYWGNDFAYDGVKVNVLQEDRCKRIISFYDQVLGSGNPPNFGVIKTKYWTSVLLQNVMGNDYLVNANFAFVGKIKTLENVFIHRRLGGLSETVKKVAVNCNYSDFTIKYPFITFWLNIFKNIVWESKTYESLNWLVRLWLGVKFSVVTFLNIDKYFQRYKMHVVNQDKQANNISVVKVTN
ncbi:MAG: glycosyltransferase family 2 protein [Candidatus Melainabacteria bacterium]|nr:glycosyltransferase family 2 protein [Candidatus Melainabacteria bacterium]